MLRNAVLVAASALLVRAQQPTDATGYWLTDAAQKDHAVCIDGTTPVYYHRAGAGSGANKWYIHHQGGGWCNDEDGCWQRSNTALGSSLNYTQRMKLEGGYFDTDPKINPHMWDWNTVLLMYCDGGSFAGSNATATVVKGKPLWFRGWHILNGAISDLVTNRGLHAATDVVVSGCSAGGLATYLHGDHWAARLRTEAPQARVVLLPDSGFFPDYEGPPKYEDRVKGVYRMQNNTVGLHPACVASTPADLRWKCFFAENTAPHLTTPAFALQSQYDTWQIGSDLGTNDTAAVNRWGQQLVALVRDRFLAAPQNGIFFDACAHHCGEWGNIRIDGDVQADAFQKWYEGGSQRIWFQNASYPCASCCHP